MTFCTACASPIGSIREPCPVCGARQEAPPQAALPPGRPLLLLRLLYLAPVLLLLAIGGGLLQRQAAQQQELATAYAVADGAAAAGQLVAARDGFAAIAGYRDAADRATAIDSRLEPLETEYLTGVQAMESGDYATAASALATVAAAEPDLRDVGARLDDARRLLASDLRRQVDAATSAHDWPAAEKTLRQLVALDPAAPDPRLQLAAQQRDHGPLVLGKDHSLWLVGPDGSEPHQLTDSLQAIWPVWSPDREQIAFLAPDPDDPMDTMALYTVAVDGSHPKRLASGVSAHTAPSWSPDGRTIAYTSFAGYDPVTESGSISVRTVDVASGNETDLTGQDYSLAFNPSWSPDGADLAFVAKDLRNNQRPQQATGDVIIVNMETKQFENVTDGAVRDVWSVAWSPRADDLLLFSLYGQTWYEPPETAVRLLHRATGAIAPIAEADEHPTAPVWSPDGSRFVFTIGDRTIVIADVAGQRVTADADKPLSGEITWSPDGGAFLLAPWDADTASTLVDLSGAQPSLSTVRLEFDANPPFVAPPQWAPAVALAPADNPSIPLPGGSGGATAR